MSETPVSRISIYIKENVRDVLEELAEENGLSLSSQIILMLKNTKEYKERK